MIPGKSGRYMPVEQLPYFLDTGYTQPIHVTDIADQERLAYIEWAEDSAVFGYLAAFQLDFSCGPNCLTLPFCRSKGTYGRLPLPLPASSDPPHATAGIETFTSTYRAGTALLRNFSLGITSFLCYG